MNRAAEGSHRWGVAQIFRILETQTCLTYDQQLKLKRDGRPCPKVTLKNRTPEAVYKSFSWICGEEERNTYFCWPCLVMGDFSLMKNVFVRESGYSSPGSNLWKIASCHEKSKKHINNHTAYALLDSVDVAFALGGARQREVDKHNRTAAKYSKMLLHHIDVAVFLSAQGLAFHSHDESNVSSNRGNFIELMDMLRGYSPELRSFLENDHVTYTSHEPQNDIIECIFKEVRQEIRNRIDNSKFIAVMMDDTSEQSAVSIRLVNNGKVEEHMLGMINSSQDQSADALTKSLTETLTQFKISPENCTKKLISLSYDGAASMSGELNGVQKQIQDAFPFAYYNHCVAHQMALCASQSANKEPKIAKFFATTDKLISFIRISPKRTTVLGRNLPNPGDTRWLSRDTAIGVVDSWYETIGSTLYEISRDPKEKAETQTTARDLCIQLQHIEFVFFLKFYRNLFEICKPVTSMLQKASVDAVQVSLMLDDLLSRFISLDFNRIWADAIAADPTMPCVRARDGWRGVEDEVDGSPDSWKRSLTAVAKNVIIKFYENIQWRFENLKRFNWIQLVHPAKFEDRKNATQQEQRVLIAELMQLYPFVVKEPVALEFNLEVLYNNKAISVLLQKLIRERDAAIEEKRLRRQRTQEESELHQIAEDESLETTDQFTVSEEEINIDAIEEGKPNVQDLLSVIKQAELEDALPHAVRLLELAVTTPITSVHCEPVFSRMKRIVSPFRSRMLQKRKEMLVFLQVEHRTLRWLSGQKSFKKNVIARFKSYNQRRLERFSRK